MNLRTIAAFVILTFAPALAVAAPKPPPEPILKLANAVITATNTDDAAALAGLFTDDAVVVDENPPFAWRGAGAGVAWWHVVDAVTRKAQMQHVKAVNVRLGEFRQSATDAYLVQALTVTGVAGAKPFAEAGTMTYTFHNAGGTWLISTMVWTTKP
ncbi:MAG: nuclear transport factor 2 family protein [Candidatus Cybelea sp.]